MLHICHTSCSGHHTHYTTESPLCQVPFSELGERLSNNHGNQNGKSRELDWFDYLIKNKTMHLELHSRYKAPLRSDIWEYSPGISGLG